MKIFVSIAGFQDPILPYTIESALQNAKYKNDIVLGVFDQSKDVLDYKDKSNIRYMNCHPKEAKGACWARSKIQKDLFAGEDIFMQVDSHTMFGENWDSDLLAKYETCYNWFQKPLLTGYPRGFNVFNGPFLNTKEKYVFKYCSEEKETPVMTIHLPFAEGLHGGQVAKSMSDSKYYRGFALSAGFIFVEGKWCQEVPIDPRIYFSGEESTMALRSFTHGWDLVHAPDVLIWHWYNTDNESLKRELHWEMHENDVELKQEKDRIIENARKIVDEVLSGKEKGKYGIGAERTLADYAHLSGIDYENKTYQRDKALFTEYENCGLELDDDFE